MITCVIHGNQTGSSYGTRRTASHRSLWCSSGMGHFVIINHNQRSRGSRLSSGIGFFGLLSTINRKENYKQQKEDKYPTNM
jgi:hypothetical protein